MVKFSVIMPTFNRAFCIDNAIRHILNQSHQEFELLIIDDGSVDNTETLIKENYSDEIKSGKIVYYKIIGIIRKKLMIPFRFFILQWR